MTKGSAHNGKKIERAAECLCRIPLCAAFVFTLTGASLARGQLFTSSIVSTEAAMPMQHGSSIIELDDGSLLVSWYAASNEAARDSRILLRHSASGGTSWEPTQIAVNPRECAAESWFSNKALGNSVLFQDKENIVWLFYAAVEFGGWSGAHVDYKVSRDRGRTWSESHRLTNGLGDIPRSKPIALGPHEIFLPLSHSALRKYPSGARLEIANGKIARKTSLPIANSKFSHPAFVAYNFNRVLAFLRARGGGKLQGTFFDPGKNGWSIPEPTNLLNPDSTIDAVRLDDGRILLVYNDNAAVRSPLSIAISDDRGNGRAEARLSAGVAFRKLRDIENEPGQDFSYPSLVRARDGTFYLTYTWHYRSAIKCVHFDANWLGLTPVSGGQ
jgi:predicted neuraminidase